MGQTPQESEQTVADFNCQKSQNIQPGMDKSVQRPEICGIEHQEANILSLTPVKTNEPLPIKCKKEEAKLPEKYKILSELFDRMTSSLRLLTLRKKEPTFRNVSRQVEVLTRRKFSYGHLAQIKFILPEAVQIEKILVHDEKTMCMEPHMKINMLLDAIEGHNEQSGYTDMQHIFLSRLFDYISTHPEGCEIPEAELPEPFNKQSITIATNLLAKNSSTESLSDITETELLKSSHLGSSFTKHFSTKATDIETEKSQLLASEFPLSSTKNNCMTDQKTGGKQKEVSDLCVEPFTFEQPLQVTCPPESNVDANTPMKFALENDKLVVETPAQATPKRSVSSDNKPNIVMCEKLMASNLSVKRSLHFTCLEGEELFLDLNSDDRNQIDGETKVEESSCCTSKDDVSNEKGIIISHQQMPTCWSDLVSIIHHIFQSAQRSSITRQELVHKIMMNKLDVFEKREVEEQLVLLEKLVPDWISKNVGSSGDLLYRVRNIPDLNTVCEKLS